MPLTINPSIHPNSALLQYTDIMPSTYWGGNSIIPNLRENLLIYNDMLPNFRILHVSFPNQIHQILRICIRHMLHSLFQFAVMLFFKIKKWSFITFTTCTYS